jgi:hypothetical protein
MVSGFLVSLYSDIEGQKLRTLGPERNQSWSKQCIPGNMVQTPVGCILCVHVVFLDCLPPGSDELAGQFTTTMHRRVMNGPLDLHASLLLFDPSLILVLGPRLLFLACYMAGVYQCWFKNQVRSFILLQKISFTISGKDINFFVFLLNLKVRSQFFRYLGK